ncbi:hypothetical protein Tco_1175009 [Tanacetum coccineum]
MPVIASILQSEQKDSSKSIFLLLTCNNAKFGVIRRMTGGSGLLGVVEVRTCEADCCMESLSMEVTGPELLCSEVIARLVSSSTRKRVFPGHLLWQQRSLKYQRQFGRPAFIKESRMDGTIVEIWIPGLDVVSECV